MFHCSRFARVDEDTDFEDLSRENPWLKTEVRSDNNAVLSILYYDRARQKGSNADVTHVTLLFSPAIEF